MVENSRQALIVALGGTFISLATMDVDELTVANFALLNSADFKSPMEAIERYLKTIPRCPPKVGISVAGVVDGERATMNHLPWSFDWNDIRAVTNAQHVAFVNEFEALALALPAMTSYDMVEIARGALHPHGTKLVIGAGTGLGAAALAWTGDKWFAMSGESRFASFPAPLGHEFDIRTVLGHEGLVSADQVFSGRGLVALYEALAKAKGAKPEHLTAPQVTKAGLSGKDATAMEAIDLIATWLGRFAGDMALHFGARGGVYLSGGLPSNITHALEKGRFNEAFLGAGERNAYLGRVPVHVIKTGADAGLRGTAIALSNSLPARGPAQRRLSSAPS